LQDEQLPGLLRVRYSHLIESLYLDIDGNVDVMAEIDLCFDWKTITREITAVGVGVLSGGDGGVPTLVVQDSFADVGLLTADDKKHMAELTAWVAKFLAQQNEHIVIEHESDNFVWS
jgi:hypothetical protein